MHPIPAPDPEPYRVRALRIAEQTWPRDTVPVVSIICISYNHESFIAECLDGFLKQETSFPVEIIVHDDASSDRTSAILRDYEAAYPNVFRMVRQKENQYSKGRSIFQIALPLARGQYLALCESDDYWTSSNKLQMQVGLLESDPGSAICFHNVLLTYEDATRAPHAREAQCWERLTLAQMLEFHDFSNPNNVTPGHTCSAVFRRSSVGNSLAWLGRSSTVSGDLPLFLLIARAGAARYLEPLMGVHRIHSKGVSSGPEHSGLMLLRNRIQMYKDLLLEMPTDCHAQVRNVIRLYERERNRMCIRNWFEASRRKIHRLRGAVRSRLSRLLSSL